MIVYTVCAAKLPTDDGDGKKCGSADEEIKVGKTTVSGGSVPMAPPTAILRQGNCGAYENCSLSLNLTTEET